MISGTESWLNENIKSCEVFPENYTVYRKDRSRLGRGVFLLIKNELISTEETNLKAECETILACETIWARVKLQNSKDLIVGSFYMPHRNDSEIKELKKILINLANRPNHKHTILTGDFDCPDINWESKLVRP